jgi:hypothetical protein
VAAAGRKSGFVFPIPTETIDKDIFTVKLQVKGHAAFEGKVICGYARQTHDNLSYVSYEIQVMPAGRNNTYISKISQVTGGNTVRTESVTEQGKQVKRNRYDFNVGAETAPVTLEFLGELKAKRDASIVAGSVTSMWKDGKELNLDNLARDAGGFIRKIVKGQNLPPVPVKKKDPNKFHNLKVFSGPWKEDAEATVSGEWTFAYLGDSDRGIWTTEGTGLKVMGSDGKADIVTGTRAYDEFSEPQNVSANGSQIQATSQYKANMMWNEDATQNEEALFAGEAAQVSEEDEFLGLAKSGKVPGISGNVYFVDEKVYNQAKKKEVVGKNTGYYSLDCRGISLVQATQYMKLHLLTIGQMLEQ